MQLLEPVEIDELLEESYAEFRRYSSTPIGVKADESYKRLTRYYLPAIGAECPAYGKALGKTLQWLSEQRDARSRTPTIRTPLAPI